MTMESDNTSSLSYAAAGVDIDAGNRLVDRIKPLAKATARAGSVSSLGGFGGLFDLADTNYNNPMLVSATDGVGTKLKLAFASGIHNTVGIDLVAMCVNDLVVQGAEPLFFLDYFACGTLSVDQAESVIAGIAEGCKDAGCALVGGETAEMPGMYEGGEYDLAGFSVGAVERDAVLPYVDTIKPGDLILGLPSSGFHSNGFSLVRKVLEQQGIGLADQPPFAAPGAQTVAEALLTPTVIYVRSCLAAINNTSSVKALAHITGGGLTENLPRVFPHRVSAHIDLSAWELPEAFTWVQKAGNITDAEMLKTFNCGVGMALIVSAEGASAVENVFRSLGEPCMRIGEIRPRDESGQEVLYSGTLSS